MPPCLLLTQQRSHVRARSQVVAILSLVANLAALPSSLVGLTLLAWGASLGDFFGNAALAKRGHASTALTACFAGKNGCLTGVQAASQADNSNTYLFAHICWRCDGAF